MGQKKGEIRFLNISQKKKEIFLTHLKRDSEMPPKVFPPGSEWKYEKNLEIKRKKKTLELFLCLYIHRRIGEGVHCPPSPPWHPIGEGGGG